MLAIRVGVGSERPVNWDLLCLCVAGHEIVLDWVWGLVAWVDCLILSWVILPACSFFSAFS